jgi:hypothetical protein
MASPVWVKKMEVLAEAINGVGVSGGFTCRIPETQAAYNHVRFKGRGKGVTGSRGK